MVAPRPMRELFEEAVVAQVDIPTEAVGGFRVKLKPPLDLNRYVFVVQEGFQACTSHPTTSPTFKQYVQYLDEQRVA